jgi:type IX secretion system PorP/SprF family membrane protein
MLSFMTTTKDQKPFFLFLLLILALSLGNAQQGAQFTQYMYNTQIINPAYMSTKDVPHLALLGRTQWTHFEGAPKTGTFSAMAPLGSAQRNAVGLSVVHEEIGPTVTSGLTLDFAHRLKVSDRGSVAFGLKAGMRLLNIDFSKLNIADGGDIFDNTVDKRVLPQVGAGVYYNDQRLYIGLSVPTFFRSEHFDLSTSEGVNLTERLHYYLLMGYILELSDVVKFKPATLAKMVSGAPVQWDLSANFMFYERLVLGASYRWSAAYSAMAGFHISEQLFLGFGYDYQSTAIENFSQGSYEIFLNFNIFNTSKCECSIKPKFY